MPQIVQVQHIFPIENHTCRTCLAVVFIFSVVRVYNVQLWKRVELVPHPRHSA